MNGVTGMATRTLYHRKLARHTSKKVVGKRKGPSLLFDFDYRLPMDFSTQGLLLLLVARRKLTRKQPGKAAERDRTKGSGNAWNVTICHKGKISIKIR